MKNFFKGFFNKPISQEPATSNSVLLSAISLMIEVSLADEIMDISELETLKKVLLNEFEVKENDLENLISDAKKNQNSSTDPKNPKDPIKSFRFDLMCPTLMNIMCREKI